MTNKFWVTFFGLDNGGAYSQRNENDDNVKWVIFRVIIAFYIGRVRDDGREKKKHRNNGRVNTK